MLHELRRVATLLSERLVEGGYSEREVGKDLIYCCDDVSLPREIPIVVDALT